MRRLLVPAVAVLLLCGATACSDNDDEGASASTTTSSALVLDDTTTSTTAAATTTTSSSSATTAGSTTTTTRAATTTTTRSSATTVVVPACGTGKATVTFTAKDIVTDALSSTFVPQVTVDNQVSKAIEVEDVSIEVTYPNGEVRTVRFTTAGTVIGAGTSASFTSDKLTTAQRYSAVRFTRFAYFTAGQKAGCLVAV